MRANGLWNQSYQKLRMQAYSVFDRFDFALLIDIHIIPLSKMFCNDFAITDL